MALSFTHSAHDDTITLKAYIATLDTFAFPSRLHIYIIIKCFHNIISITPLSLLHQTANMKEQNAIDPITGLGRRRV